MRRQLVLACLAAMGATASLPESARAQDEEEAPQRYGDSGTSEANVLLGISSEGVAFGGGFRHFVLDAVAPGVEAAVYREDGITEGFTFASLRLVPLRFEKVALVLTGRAGRMYISEHIDGWAYGGDAGVLFLLSRHVGLEIGYEVLQLAPASFCEDLVTCVLKRPVLGVRIVF